MSSHTPVLRSRWMLVFVAGLHILSQVVHGDPPQYGNSRLAKLERWANEIRLKEAATRKRALNLLEQKKELELLEQRHEGLSNDLFANRSHLRSAADSARQARRRMQPLIIPPYNGCENHLSFARCDHEHEKKKYLAKVRRLERDYQKQQALVSQAQQNATNLEELVQTTQQRISTSEDEIRRKRSEIATARMVLDQDVDQLVAEARRLKEYWRDFGKWPRPGDPLADPVISIDKPSVPAGRVTSDRPIRVGDALGNVRTRPRDVPRATDPSTNQIQKFKSLSKKNSPGQVFRPQSTDRTRKLFGLPNGTAKPVKRKDINVLVRQPDGTFVPVKRGDIFRQMGKY